MAASVTMPVAFNRERYRTFWERFWAGCIDGLVLAVPLGVLLVLLSKVARGSVATIAENLIAFNCAWVYSVLMHWRYGQTVGKRYMGVTVLDVSEKHLPTFRQAFLRDIGNIVSDGLATIYVLHLVATHQYAKGAEDRGLPGAILQYAGMAWFLLEVVTMLSNQKRRALHDWIAGTVVVCEDPPVPVPAPEPILVVDYRTGKPDLRV